MKKNLKVARVSVTLPLILFSLLLSGVIWALPARAGQPPGRLVAPTRLRDPGRLTVRKRLRFGRVLACTENKTGKGKTKTKNLVVKNNGPGPVTFSNIPVITGANFSFAAGNTCIGTTLAPKQRCTVPITFTPFRKGRVKGTLTLIDNASNGPQQIVKLVGGGRGKLSCQPKVGGISSSASGVVLSPGTQVLSSGTLRRLSSVSKGNSAFAFTGTNRQLQSLTTGDVIIFGMTNLTPSGLVRRITSIDASATNTLIITSPATMADAFESGTFSFGGVLKPSAITMLRAEKGVTLRTSSGTISFGKALKPSAMTMLRAEKMKTSVGTASNAAQCGGSNYDYALQLANVPLYNQTIKGASVIVTATGYICFSLPVPTAKWHFTNSTLEDALFEVTPTEYANVTLSTTGVPPPMDYEKTIATIGFIVIAGPIVVVPEVDVNVGVKGQVSAQITAGFNETGQVDVGASYSNDAWSPIATPSLSQFCYNVSPEASASAEVYGGPEVAFLFYGAVGPDLTGYGDLSANYDSGANPQFVLDAGFILGGGVSLLGYTHNFPILNYEYPIVEGGLPPVDTGQICPSVNGINPTQSPMQSPPPPAPTYSLVDDTYGNGTFVAVGIDDNPQNPAYGEPAILTSPHGSKFTAATLPAVHFAPNGIAYGAGTFVTVGLGAGSNILVSINGTSWADSSYDASIYALNDVAFGNGIFVAVGSNTNTGDDAILTSTDGSHWTPAVTSATTYIGSAGSLKSVAYANGVFVAVGDSWPSYDAAIITSTDGTHWTPAASLPSAMGVLEDVTSGGGLFVAVGGNNPAGLAPSALIFTSSDGTHWNAQPAGSLPAGGLNAVAYGGSTFVAAGGQGIYTSSDGSTWGLAHIFKKTVRFSGIAYGGQTFLLVGSGSLVFTPSTSPYVDNGLNWTQLEPPDSPSARGTGAMVYDPTIGKIVLFGGANSSTINNETWTFDGNTWTQLHPANSPSERNYFGMTYDGATGLVTLYGGCEFCGSMLGDTWTFDGGNWTQQNPATSPPGRDNISLAYDEANQAVVLFSGSTAPDVQGPADTWTWDGTNWTQQNPANSPPPRQYYSIAYDRLDQGVLLFGGSNGSGQLLDDTWLWNGSNWSQEFPTTSPPARSGATMVYDPELGGVVLFGGSGANGLLDDTWLWDGSNWMQLSPTTFPSPRAGYQMDFDSAIGKLVLFGGQASDGFLGDTWDF